MAVVASELVDRRIAGQRDLLALDDLAALVLQDPNKHPGLPDVAELADQIVVAQILVGDGDDASKGSGAVCAVEIEEHVGVFGGAVFLDDDDADDVASIEQDAAHDRPPLGALGQRPTEDAAV